MSVRLHRGLQAEPATLTGATLDAVAVSGGAPRSVDGVDRSVLEEAGEFGADDLRGGADLVTGPLLEESGEVDGARVKLQSVRLGQKIEDDPLSSCDHRQVLAIGGKVAGQKER